MVEHLNGDWMNRFGLILGMVFLLCACEEDARNDANLFLVRVERVDLDDAPDEREAHVRALENLPLRNPQIREVRDLCVNAHRTLLRAEGMAQEAREQLAALEGQDTVPADSAREIEVALTRSNALLAESRHLFPRCTRRTEELQMRYRRRRTR